MIFALGDMTPLCAFLLMICMASYIDGKYLDNSNKTSQKLVVCLA